MNPRSRQDKVEAEIAGLAVLSRQELVELWVKAHGCKPPKGVKRGLLERSAAYHIQARAFGGLRSATRRYLLAVAAGKFERPSEASVASTKRRSLPRSGARLVRQWNGKTHTVDVVDHGFLWNGRPYRSLSAIAREITGARWSGPRFFGL